MKSATKPSYLLCTAVAGAAFLLSSHPLWSITITNYENTVNDRFHSGFPSAPVRNTDPAFIGLDYDWSGVAWNAGRARQGVALISPRHYLFARHFDGISTLRIFDQNGQVQSLSKQSVEATGFGVVFQNQTLGDLSIGTVTQPSGAVARYGILDLNDDSSSNSPNNYNSLNLFIYGHGGSETASTRVGTTPVSFASVNGTDHQFRTTRDDVQLVELDSGSPAFTPWTNPNGDPELAVLGNHAAISVENNINFHSLAGTREVMGKLNEFMNDDGYALRLVGNPEHTWNGGSTTALSADGAWGYSGRPRRISDYYVLFDPAQSTNSNVSVDTNFLLRGLYFKNSPTSDDGFSFDGTSTLTIGRGGITNYDNDTQTFSNILALGAPQYWSIGSGAIILANLNNNGHLLEIGGPGGVNASGNVSGTGGLALSEGTLSLDGNSTYTGPTWIHGGILFANGNISSSSSLTVGNFGILAGSGTTPGILGPGTISPGNSTGILTPISVAPSSGMDFDFEFTSFGEPAFGNASASINDLLRITAATPFSASMTSANRIRLFLNTEGINDGDVIEGGFYTDSATDFLASIENADLEIYVPDAGGSVSFGSVSYSLYGGSLEFSLSTEPQDANFGAGTVSGRIMRLTVFSPIPNAPTNASARAVSTSAIDLTWADNSSNEDGFLIERRFLGGSYAKVAALSANITTYSDTALTDGTIYEYRITAFNAAGGSASVETNGSTYSKIENWRLIYFDTADNSGDAANDKDPDLDSIVNLIEFATGSNPTTFSPNPLDTSRLGGDGQVSFDWRIDSGYDFSLGFSTDLETGFTYEDSETLDNGSSQKLELIGISDPVESIETRTYGVRETVGDPGVFLRLQVN